MSSKIYNLGPTELIPQSDFTSSQNENGGWIGSQSFLMHRSAIDSATFRAKFPPGVAATTLDPNLPEWYSFLKVSKAEKLGYADGGYGIIGVEYVGFWTSTSAAGGDPTTAEAPTYSLRGALKSAPIQTHPKWTALGDAAKRRLGWLIYGSMKFDAEAVRYGSLDETTGVFTAFDNDAWPAPPTGDELEFAIRISDGRLTYDIGTYEWTKRWCGSTGLTAAQLNDLSKIANPPGSPPNPGDDRNYMLVMANQEQSGTGELSFTNELVFLMSDAGGWDSFLQS